MRAVTDHLNKQKAIRVCVLLAADVVLINLAAFLALFVRFEFDYGALLVIRLPGEPVVLCGDEYADDSRGACNLQAV